MTYMVPATRSVMPDHFGVDPCVPPQSSFVFLEHEYPAAFPAHEAVTFAVEGPWRPLRISVVTTGGGKENIEGRSNRGVKLLRYCRYCRYCHLPGELSAP